MLTASQQQQQHQQLSTHSDNSNSRVTKQPNLHQVPHALNSDACYSPNDQHVRMASTAAATPIGSQLSGPDVKYGPGQPAHHKLHHKLLGDGSCLFGRTSAGLLPSLRTEVCNPGFWRGALGECVASMMLTFVICATWISWEPYEGDLVKISLASGFIYSALIYSFGPISGGHLNPILSFSFMITRKITVLRGLLYMIAQCTGSTCGALLLFACVPEVARKNLGVNMMSTSLIPKHGFGFEATLSFILVFMALSTIDAKLEIPGCKSIGIGLTYSALHFAGLSFSGASFNPARSLGPALVIYSWHHHWIYWVGPFFGSAMASLFYFIVFDPYNPINAYKVMNN